MELYYKEHKDKNFLLENFRKHQNIRKNPDNLTRLQKIIHTIRIRVKNDSRFFESDTQLNDYVLHEYYTHKPVVLDCYFFPNENNEIYVVNMLRKCKHTLDIAIFTLTNDRIYAAIEEAFNRGVKVRIIADDECSNMGGSDIFKLASIV